MNRRTFLRTAGVGCAAALAGCRTVPNHTQSRRFPHIVYILADDMGYGDPACLNPESKIPTPNMDRLCREGVTFTDAHSGSAVCTPTRYGIMTGRYSWRTHLKSGVLYSPSPPLIAPDRLTVASLLRNAGYRTACIGKWHLGLGWATTDGQEPTPMNLDYSKPVAEGPCARGFDYYFGIPASLDMIPYVYIENDRVVEPATEHTEGGEGTAFHRGGPIAPHFKVDEVLPTLTRKAVECIDRHAKDYADKPLFLYFPLPAPHAPIVPSQPFVGKTGIGPYGDFVAECDWTVGEVLSALERNGMDRDTLFIFTSDNGAAPVSDFDALYAKGHNPNYVFRGHKADIFEGGHHIPFLARWPGHIRPQSTYPGVICLGDLMATAAEITGQKLPDNAGEDSVSFLPALLGQTSRTLHEAIVHHSSNGSFAIRQGPWKLELCPGSGGWSKPRPQDTPEQELPPIQLYNLAEEIGERRNLQADHPEIVQRLTRLLEKYVAEGRSTPGKPQANDTPVNLWGPQAQKKPAKTAG